MLHILTCIWMLHNVKHCSKSAFSLFWHVFTRFYYLPHLDLNRNLLELKASVLPMSYPGPIWHLFRFGLVVSNNNTLKYIIAGDEIKEPKWWAFLKVDNPYWIFFFYDHIRSVFQNFSNNINLTIIWLDGPTWSWFFKILLPSCH